MRYDDIWPLADQITAVVDAMGLMVWGLSYDQSSGIFTLELADRLTEGQIEEMSSQLPFSSDYLGEGSYGSLFRLYP